MAFTDVYVALAIEDGVVELCEVFTARAKAEERLEEWLREQGCEPYDGDDPDIAHDGFGFSVPPEIDLYVETTKLEWRLDWKPA